MGNLGPINLESLSVASLFRKGYDSFQYEFRIEQLKDIMQTQLNNTR